MTNPFGCHPRNIALRSAIVIVLLLLVTGVAQAQDQNLAFCTNGVPPCNPSVPPKPGEPGCYRPPAPPTTCQNCKSCTRSPCYVASGAYTTSATDFGLPTTGFPIAVTRLYQSTFQIDGESGYGWISGLSARLYYTEREATAGNAVMEADVRLTNGFLYRFIENGNGTFTPPAGRFDTLVRNADGTWDLWLQRTRSRYHFSTTGNLLEMVDDYGNRLVWSYAGDRLDRITDASGSGRFIQIDWGADGRISDITDPIGRNIHYTYEGGVLTDVRNPLAQSTRYTYEPGKYTPRLTGINDHWHRNITTITYVGPDQDRVLSYTDKGETYTYAYGYNGVATTTAKSDSSGHTWLFPFGDGGLVTDDIPPGGGLSSHTIFDANGLVQQYTDARNVRTRYTYNTRGNVLTKTVADGTPAAVEWRFAYDVNFPDRVTSIAGYKTGTNDVHPHWQASRYDYYPPGSTAPGALRHVYEVDADGTTAHVMRTYTYDSHGRTLTETFANGAAWSRFYDSAGNLEREESPANNLAGIRPARTFTYDAVGRMETQTDALGNVTTLAWDDLNRPVSRTEPPLSTSPKQGFTTTIRHDELEATSMFLVSTKVDPNGVAASVARDGYGQIRRQTNAGDSIHFIWEKGLLKSKRDSNDYETSYAYDARRRLNEIRYPDSTLENYTYHVDGTMETFRDRAGTLVTYQYDEFKRLTAAAFPTGTVRWTYEGQKEVLEEDTRPGSAGTISNVWNPSFRVESEQQGNTGTLAWTYDSAGRLLTETVAGGATTTYGYHDDGNVRTIQWSPVQGTFVHEYDLAGRLTDIQFPNAQRRSWSYDAVGRLTTAANTHPVTGNLAAFDYEYDVNPHTGQETRVGLLTRATATFPALALAGAVTKFDYDVRGRLIRADYPQGAPYQGMIASWTFDAAGNRTSFTTNGSTSGYSYRKYGTNPLNGSVLETDGQNVYTYDAAGNTKTRSGNRGSYTFDWDADHRLLAVSGDESESYRYDASIRRVATTTVAGTTNHLYSGLQRIQDSGASSAQYLYAPGLDQPLAMVRGGQTYYFAVDGLKSVVAVTNDSGMVVNSYAYDAWGATVARQETVTNPLGFTARPRAAAGLADHRFRSYEAATGSFRSFDPLITFIGEDFATGEASSISELPAYAYAAGRPTTFNDPLGLHPSNPNAPQSCPTCWEKYVGDTQKCGREQLENYGLAVTAMAGCVSILAGDQALNESKARTKVVRRLASKFVKVLPPVAAANRVACFAAPMLVYLGNLLWDLPPCFRDAKQDYLGCTDKCTSCPRPAPPPEEYGPGGPVV